MIIYQHRIYRRDLRNNPDVYYLFGDNTARVGLGGQAKELRGEPNAIGIATKTDPSTYFSDNTLKANARIIWDDFQPALFSLLVGHTLVIPSDGLGTGLSKLPEKAPRTNKALGYIMWHLEEINKADNEIIKTDMANELRDHIERQLGYDT